MLATITALLLSHATPGALPEQELAPAILYAAAQHNVSPILLTQILLVESRGLPHAVNSDTDDHGLMQINEATRKLYGISKWCIKQWRCNLHAGARILADGLRLDGGRPCVYNVGPRGRFEKYANACLRYERKLATVF